MSAISKSPARRAAARPGVALLALLLSGTAMAGCMKTGPRMEAPFLLANPNERHPILVENAEANLDLAIYGGAYGLSAAQRNQLYSFLQEFERENGSQIVIKAPSGGPNERATMSVFNDVKGIMKARGYTSAMVQLQPYYAGYKSGAPLRISYMRYVAKGPDCPDWSENVARDPQNMPYPNLGCATQANLAAQVDNPRDLIEPRAMTPRSGERRDVTWGKYVNGEVSGSLWAPDKLPTTEHANTTAVGGGSDQ